jgi:hypothetical protein
MDRGRRPATKENSTCWESLNVKINGFLDFLEYSKFGKLTVRSHRKSQGDGYRVSYGPTLKLSSKREYWRGDATGEHRLSEPMKIDYTKI